MEIATGEKRGLDAGLGGPWEGPSELTTGWESSASAATFLWQEQPLPKGHPSHCA